VLVGAVEVVVEVVEEVVEVVEMVIEVVEIVVEVGDVLVVEVVVEVIVGPVIDDPGVIVPVGIVSGGVLDVNPKDGVGLHVVTTSPSLKAPSEGGSSGSEKLAGREPTGF
jgi:hypothetical protein